MSVRTSACARKCVRECLCVHAYVRVRLMRMGVYVCKYVARVRMCMCMSVRKRCEFSLYVCL